MKRPAIHTNMQFNLPLPEAPAAARPNYPENQNTASGWQIWLKTDIRREPGQASSNSQN